MGMSLSTAVSFGVVIEEESQWYPYDEENEDEEFDEVVDFVIFKDKVEIPDPWKSYPSDEQLKELYWPNDPSWWQHSTEARRRWEQDNPWWDEEYKEYKRIKEELEQNIPIEIETYGNYSYDYCGYIIALRGYTSSSWDSASPLKIPNNPSEEEIQNAVEFCKNYGLQSFENAQWLVSASYG